MAATTPLQGIDLIDCAKANAEQGTAIAAERCGYGTDENRFLSELKQAAAGIGVEVNRLEDLVTDTKRSIETPGLDIGPESPSIL